MNIPMDFETLNDFIRESNLFDSTRDSLKLYLENWWNDNKAVFLEDMGADLETVLKKYRFENEGLSFSRSYFYDPPLDYISVWIHIFDEEDSYISEYTAFYDLDLEIFDDKIIR